MSITTKKKPGGTAGFFGPSGFTWKPTDIANCGLWLEGDLGVTLTSSKVSTWADQSGNGRNFTQGTAANRPTYTKTLNGISVLTGDGANVKLTSSWTPGQTNNTVFVVSRNLDSTLTNNVDTLFVADNNTFTGIRLESFNYFSNATQRGIVANGAGTNTPYKNGLNIPGRAETTYVALNEWTLATGTFSGTSGLTAARLFSNYDGSIMANIDLAAVIVYERILSASEQAKVEQYLALKWGQQHNSIANRTIVCEGDSLTRGYGLDVDGSWPYQLWGLYGNNNGYYMHNAAVDGSTLLDVDSRCSGANGIDSFTFNPDGKTYLVLWAGTNDIYVGSVSAATAYSRLNTTITNRKATGKYYKIIVVNCIPRGNNTSGWSDYNTQISTNWASLQSAGADVLVDVTTDTAFDGGTDPNNATYYNADLTHLTNAGEAKIAALVKAAIDSLP